MNPRHPWHERRLGPASEATIGRPAGSTAERPRALHFPDHNMCRVNTRLRLRIPILFVLHAAQGTPRCQGQILSSLRQNCVVMASSVFLPFLFSVNTCRIFSSSAGLDNVSLTVVKVILRKKLPRLRHIPSRLTWLWGKDAAIVQQTLKRPEDRRQATMQMISLGALALLHHRCTTPSR